MTNSIKIHLSKRQGFKDVDFGEPYGTLKVRTIGSNESLEVNRLDRESSKALSKAMELRRSIIDVDLNNADEEKLKEVQSTIDKTTKLTDKQSANVARILDIYTGCFAPDDRKVGREILNTLTIREVQGLFFDIFSGVNDEEHQEKEGETDNVSNN